MLLLYIIIIIISIISIIIIIIIIHRHGFSWFSDRSGPVCRHKKPCTLHHFAPQLCSMCLNTIWTHLDPIRAGSDPPRPPHWRKSTKIRRNPRISMVFAGLGRPRAWCFMNFRPVRTRWKIRYAAPFCTTTCRKCPNTIWTHLDPTRAGSDPPRPPHWCKSRKIHQNPSKSIKIRKVFFPNSPICFSGKFGPGGRGFFEKK